MAEMPPELPPGGSVGHAKDVMSLSFSGCACAATEDGVKIWDLESKRIVQERISKPEMTSNKTKVMYSTSLAWSFDGTTLFTGYADGTIRVWKVTQQSIGNDV